MPKRVVRNAYSVTRLLKALSGWTLKKRGFALWCGQIQITIGGSKTLEKHEDMLVALRQIIRAIDLHSRQLSKESGLTGPQLLLLQSISEHGDITMRKLAQATHMSQATATTIIDRLEQKLLVRRERSQTDKRKVYAVLTDEGKDKLKTAPRPLQESFIQRFQALAEWEQNLLLSSVQRISLMMNANDLDVAPLLQVGSLLHE